MENGRGGETAARAQGRAHLLCLQLERLLRDLPPDHPSGPHLREAVRAARRQWATLVEAGQDRLLAQAPARHPASPPDAARRAAGGG